MEERDSGRYSLFDNVIRKLDLLSSNRKISTAVYSIGIALFFGLVLLPPIVGILLKLDKIGLVLQDAALLARAQSAILWSFIVAFLVAAADLVAGIPLAWFIVRTRSQWANILDTLADIPFIIPTVALGFSIRLFWSESNPLASSTFAGFSISPGLILVLLLHFAFSYPVVVRVMVGELLSYKHTYEIAARTLGAEPFTAVRTITLPILRPAIIAAYLLSFSRSLSETGATVIVAGRFENGPVFIRNALDSGLEGPMVLVSTLLIVTSVLTFAIISLVAPKIRLPITRVWPDTERKLSEPAAVSSRNFLTLAVFLLLVLLPSLFVALPSIQSIFDGTIGAAISGGGPWYNYWRSMILTYTIAAIVTVVNMVLGMPMAILIGRRRLGTTLTSMIDTMVNVPIVVPSVALGVSLGLFWRALGILPEFWVLVFAHMTITYTYFVRAMSAAVESIPTYYEEAARTLGARPFAVFRRVVLPLTKYSLLSGAIMTFTRSVDETGAATAVARDLKTAPVLLVDWVKGVVPVSETTLALGIGFLVATSFLALLALRIVTRRR
ncbi:MAG: ABC transporter permease subunit [archaeon]